MAGNGVSAFRGIQAGLQVHSSTAPNGFGVKVGATTYLLGTLQLTPQTQFYNPREERNSRIETHRVVPVARHGEMRFESSLQFQRAHQWFGMFMGNAGIAARLVSTGTPVIPAITAVAARQSGNSVVEKLKAADGSSGLTAPGVWLWTYAPKPNELLQPDIYTIEYGDNAEFYNMQDSFLRNFNMRYDMNNAVMVSADMFGKFPLVASQTADIAQPFVHDAVSQFTDLYVGDVNDANLVAFHATGSDPAPALNGIDLLGELDTSNTVLSAMSKPGLANSLSISIPTGIEMTRYTSGGLDFTDYGQMMRTVSVDLTLRHSDAGRVEFAKYTNLSDRRRLFRFVTKGPEILARNGWSLGATDAAGTGATKHNRFIAVDMTVLYSDSPQFFTEQGGDDLFTIRGSGYHEPAANWNRDMVAYVQNDRRLVNSDVDY